MCRLLPPRNSRGARSSTTTRAPARRAEIAAHNAASLGLRVQFTSLVGRDDLGRVALDRLRAAGVDTTGVVVDDEVQTGVTVLLPHGGERHILTFLGSISLLTTEHVEMARLAEARHLHLCSLYLQRGLHEGLVPMLRELRSRGVTISLDPNDDPSGAWGPPLDAVLPLVDLFMPNEDELRRMAGGASLEEAVRLIGERVPTLVVKRGREGCRVRHGGEVVDVPPLLVEAVDTIGAGDSFDAGFLSAYVRGKSLEGCARSGNITGALSVLGTGGTESFRDRGLREAFLQQQGFHELQ